MTTNVESEALVTLGTGDSSDKITGFDNDRHVFSRQLLKFVRRRQTGGACTNNQNETRLGRRFHMMTSRCGGPERLLLNGGWQFQACFSEIET